MNINMELSDIKHDIRELKHRSDAERTFALSSMNTERRFKLAKCYGTDGKVTWIKFGNFPVLGNCPPLFVWGDNAEDAHAAQYTKYIQDMFLGSPYVDEFIVMDVHTNKQLWNLGRAHGTTDVIVYPDITRFNQDVITLFFELKKVL